MDTRELYERGLALRKSLFGSDAVDKRMQEFGDFGAPLQQIINAYIYGDVWSRTALSPKQRFRPRATLYSPPPSQTSNERVV